MTHISASNVPTESEIQAMAFVLVRRYLSRGTEVATHFVIEYEAIGDDARAALSVQASARILQHTPGPTFS
jgi:uncharacterized membrane protein